MIELFAIILASIQADAPPPPPACGYGIDHFVGIWRADPTDEASDNETSVIEFSRSGGRSKWRQYLHYRQLDEGRWLTTDECGTVTLLSPTSPIIVARFKAVGKDRIQLERSGQVYTRSTE